MVSVMSIDIVRYAIQLDNVPPNYLTPEFIQDFAELPPGMPITSESYFMCG